MDGSPSTKIRVVTVDNSSIYVPRRGTTLTSPHRFMDVAFGNHGGRWSSLDPKLVDEAGLGPGSYVARGCFRGDNAESYSRRGTGGLASRDSRFSKKRSDFYAGPGPGAYSARERGPSGASISGRQTLSPRIGIYSSFVGPGHLPLDQLMKPGTTPNLGPGSYALGTDLGGPGGPAIGSSFQSGTRRLADASKSALGPGPGAYRAKVSVAYVGECPHSQFKDGTGHSQRSPIRRRAKKLMGDRREVPSSSVLDLAIREKNTASADVPGPGAYYNSKVSSIQEQTGTSWRGSSAFVAPMGKSRKPRVPESAQIPGPGQYDGASRPLIRTDLGGARSSFVSHSARIQQSLTGVPGPAFYRPQSPTWQRSQHYNAKAAPVMGHPIDAFVV